MLLGRLYVRDSRDADVGVDQVLFFMFYSCLMQLLA